MKKVIRLTEADLTRIIKRVISEEDSLSTDLATDLANVASKYGFIKWGGDTDWLLRLPKGSSPKTDVIRVNAFITSDKELEMFLAIKANTKDNSGGKLANIMKQIENMLGEEFRIMNLGSNGNWHDINGRGGYSRHPFGIVELKKILDMLLLLKVDQKNNAFI